MTTLWLIVYITMAILVVVIIPFATFYYEGDEYDESGQAPSQIMAAVKGTLITFFVYAIISVVMYVFLGIAEIPVVQINARLTNSSYPTVPVPIYFTNGTAMGQLSPLIYCVTVTTPHNYSTVFNETYGNGSYIYNSTTGAIETGVNITTYYNTTNVTCYYDDTYARLNVQLNLSAISNSSEPLGRFNAYVKFRVTFALWIVSIVVFFGWFLFILFGGIGMVAMPMDCIASWRRRPVRISLEKYVTRKKEIGEQATKLIEKGKAIQDRQKKGRERKRDRRNYNKFRQAVFLLEEDYERLQECYKRQGGKVILHFLTFIWGCISVGLTIMWLLQIILYVFTYPYPFSPFLNTMVIKLDDAFGLLGTAAYGLFSFYLLLCCIKGNFKFGMRVFFLFPIHPMRVGNTLMNAFLFNVTLIIICAFAVTQFCTTAFADYTSRTAINSLFALSVKNLMGLKYIFIGYVYALFIMVFLTAFYFFIKPKDKPAIDDIRV
jgi:LMBR1 domain-containing protein 1